MDIPSYLLGKSQGGGGGGTPIDVQINGTSITSNNTADIITNSAYNASSNKIATMDDITPILNINLTTVIEDAGTESLNEHDEDLLTEIFEEWLETIDKTQLEVREVVACQINYGEYNDTLYLGSANFFYNNDINGQQGGIELNFGFGLSYYGCGTYYDIINNEVELTESLCSWNSGVDMNYFEETVGEINTILESLVSVEEGE